MRSIQLATLTILALILSGLAGAGAATGEALTPGDQQLSYLPFVMFDYTQGDGTITGRVFNGASQERVSIPGATICYKSLCATTGDDGMYTLEGLPDGLRRIDASATDFYSTREEVVVRTDETSQRDIALTPLLELTDVFMRVVLTWDPTPTWPPENTRNDLDANLWMQRLDPPEHLVHIFSDTASRGDCTTFPNACLESDYQQGYGPETVAIRQLESTVYYFGVLNYYAGYPGVPPITESQAKVRVYLETGTYYEFSVPTTGNGDFWYAFSMVSDGVTASLQERNCITTYNGEPPTCPVVGIQSFPITPRKQK
jgi:hypothetical protein